MSDQILVRFARKPCSIEDIEAAGRDYDNRAEAIEITETKSLNAEEYDSFIKNILSDHEWLTGKGGYDNGLRKAVAITAPDRKTLYADPSGYSYARYVGLQVPDHSTRFPDVRVQLTGMDGNAFNVLGLCRRAAQRAGVPGEQIKQFMAEATIGDYDHLLATCMRWFDCA